MDRILGKLTRKQEIRYYLIRANNRREQVPISGLHSGI